MATDGKIRFYCRCGRRLKFSAASIGKQFSCPNCGQVINIESLNGRPTAVLDDTTRPISAKLTTNTSEGINTNFILVSVALGVIVGVLVSQYAPHFEELVGEGIENVPWNTQRLAVLPYHCIIYGFGFGIVSFLITFVKSLMSGGL